MVPTFTMESIDEGGARLDPDSIATPTPQFFDVASPPDRQTGFGVGPHRTSGTGHALHTGPYPSGLSRLWTYGASDSGSSRTPSHHCLPDPSRLTVPTRPVRCQGCSHHRVRSHVPSGRTGGLLRRSPLRTARAAFTASSSSKPRGRLRCVVLFLTVARFPSCAAVKIRCRSRRTLSSWCRQSTASHEGRVLGSVHHLVSNLSFGSGAQGPLRFTGSPVHVSASFEARAPGPVSSQLSSNDGLEEPFKVVLVSCRLSPAGIRFLDILFPPENSALLTVGLPGRHQGGPDSVGVPMFRTHEMRPGWVPPLPRGGGVLPTGAASPIGACRFPTASPIPR